MHPRFDGLADRYEGIVSFLSCVGYRATGDAPESEACVERLSWLDDSSECGHPEILWEDGDRRICRTPRKGADGIHHSFITIAPVAERPSRSSISRLTHEYALREHLDGAWALRPLELVLQRGRPTLVFEDNGGGPLERLIGRPMEVAPFLRVAIALAQALGQVHQRGLVHKDIKPANVLVGPGGAAWLTGFGIASRLPRERQAPEAPEIIAGTLAYMSPEQTGRMNRSIDSRSDLYSLGITFYQMLTGVLPFTASDPMGWVHCHIAKRPVAPSERAQVPSAVSAIVMKLLVKTAEDRYQTAAGVESDLRRCLTDWQHEGQIASFSPGLNDTPDRLLMPEKLYGRDREIETLLSAFDRVVKGGSPELVLVSGYSGIGKSSVISELHKVLVPPRGLFASGKFDQYKRDIPYSTLAQAFQSLTRRLLVKSDAELAPWRNALREALAPNGLLMTELVPELALIIGEQSPVPELPPQQAQSRFQLVFRRFIGVFAQPEHPLALALDDLQWLDTATLDLVEDLLTRANLQHLILIGAYRDNEVGPSHPLARKIEAIQQAGAKVHHVRLAPLDRGDLSQLVEDGLRCEPARAAPLAQLLHDKTGGNPFFAIQFLAELAEEGLITNDQGRWSWDPDRIHAKGYTANVADLMVGRLGRLPAPTKAALQQMACLGNRAGTAALAIAHASPQGQVTADLWDAVRLELIESVEGGFRFVHDRVHEAAYGLIPATERAAAHLRIGRLLLAGTASDDLEDAVFDVVNQFNRGAELMTDVHERQRVAELNVVAGKRAKRSTAYASARNYLVQAVALLAPEPWARRYEESFELFLLLSECEYLVGNFDAADMLFDTILSKSKSELDAAKVHSLRIKLYQVSGKYDEGLAVGLRALRAFGVTFPESENDIEAAVQAQFASLPERLGGRSIGDFLEAPTAVDPVTWAIVDLLVESAPCAYIARPPLFPLVTLEAVHRSIRDGNTVQSPFAYGVVALWLVSVPQEIHLAYQFSEFSLRLNERFDNRRLRGTLLHLNGDHVNFWRRHFATGLPILEQAFTACLEVGDYVYGGFLAFQIPMHVWENGHALEEVLASTARFAAFAQQSHNDAIHETILLEQRFVRLLMGSNADPMGGAGSIDPQASVDVTVRAAFISGTAFHHVMNMMFASLCGRHVEALEAAAEAEPMIAAVMAMPMEASFHFFHALSLASLYPTLPALQQQQSLRQLKHKHGKFVLWTEHCPENFEGRAALIGAEIARVEGRELDAQRLYEHAIRTSEIHGFIHHQAVACETAARFYAGRGFRDIATLYLRNASHCYMRWGAGAKVRLLDEEHPGLRDESRAHAGTSTMGTPVEHLELATVIKVSQAVSGEIVLEKLIETLLRTAIEHAGAERGVLVLTEGGAHRVAAEARTSGDSVIVQLRDEPVTQAHLPESVCHFVLRSLESVILDDASADGAFSSDPYIQARCARSVLCLPLLNRAKLIGMLYLENNLAPQVFAPARVPVLKLLASEAAISLENTRLYGALAERESRIRRLVEANIIGIFIWDHSGQVLDANDALLFMLGYDRQDLSSGGLCWTDLTPPNWRELDSRMLKVVKESGRVQAYEKEFFRRDGSRVPVMIGAASFDVSGNEGVAFVLDLSERKRSEAEARDSQRRYHELELRLADANRMASIGQLSASVAHELNQPLAGIVANASVCVRRLGVDPPDVPGAMEPARRLIRDAHRASEVIKHLRALFAKAETVSEWVDVNEAAREIVALSSTALHNERVDLRCEFEEDLPPVKGDRIQLQQVIMNLLRNAADAMTNVDAHSRHLLIRTGRSEDDRVQLTVRDTGIGLSVDAMEKLFEAFYTTKSGGMGIGLSVSRSIIERHNGRLWGEPNEGPGASFSFTIPIPSEVVTHWSAGQ